MRQSNTQFMKRILKIAIFILGVLIIITGIISGSYALVQIPEGSSEFMPYFVIAVLTLPAGIGLCILAIKVPRYLAESRKMSKEEKVIENLRKYMKQRKQRIAAFALSLMLMVSTSILILWKEKKLNEMITPENIRKMASFENPKHELPILFCRFYILAGHKAKLRVYELFFGLSTGFFIALLITEFAGFTKNKHRVTLNMWERIQQLEKEVKELKTGTQANNQDIDEPDSGEDAVSG